MNETHYITPLDAAIVEALPDRKDVAKVKREFRKTGKCPTSVFFPTEESVAEFYAENTKKKKEIP